MAEPTITKDATKGAARDEGPSTGGAAKILDPVGGSKDAIAKTPAASRFGGQPPHIVLRVLIGLAGLSLLIGFFLPWVNDQATETSPEVAHAGWEVALGRAADIPATQALWALPALGLLLSVAGFMGFRWAGQLAIAFGAAILSFAFYVVLRIFVDRTELGLWIVAGGTFVVLLLGVIAWMVESRKKLTAKPDAKPASASSARAD